MKQEADLLRALRREMERARDVNLSPNEVARAAGVPVGRTTLYRWLCDDECNPGVRQLEATLAAVRRFLDAEQTRFARGANTQGGPWIVDEEARIVKRGNVAVGLKGQEFELFIALDRTPRALLRSWICEHYAIPPKSFERALSELRRKIKNIDLKIIPRRSLLGDGVMYALAEITEGDRRISA